MFMPIEIFVLLCLLASVGLWPAAEFLTLLITLVRTYLV